MKMGKWENRITWQFKMWNQNSKKDKMVVKRKGKTKDEEKKMGISHPQWVLQRLKFNHSEQWKNSLSWKINLPKDQANI